MFVRRALALVLAVVWLWPATLHAQALREAYRRGQALYDAGQYEQAIPFWRKVLEFGELEAGSDHPAIATFLNNLAELYRAQGRYEVAEPLHKRALAINENALGPNHPDVATGLNNLAVLYDAQGRYEAAEPLRKRALSVMVDLVPCPPRPILHGIQGRRITCYLQTKRKAEKAQCAASKERRRRGSSSASC